MKRSEQLAINEKVVALVNSFKSSNNYALNWRKLRSCSAEVAPIIDAETGELIYYVLRSYRTVVAAIDVRTDTLYDFLRYVYGYTATSAQHIAKFDHDYGMGKWGCANRVTYREV